MRLVPKGVLMPVQYLYDLVDLVRQDQEAIWRQAHLEASVQAMRRTQRQAARTKGFSWLRWLPVVSSLYYSAP